MMKPAHWTRLLLMLLPVLLLSCEGRRAIGQWYQADFDYNSLTRQAVVQLSGAWGDLPGGAGDYSKAKLLEQKRDTSGNWVTTTAHTFPPQDGGVGQLSVTLGTDTERVVVSVTAPQGIGKVETIAKEL